MADEDKSASKELEKHLRGLMEKAAEQDGSIDPDDFWYGEWLSEFRDGDSAFDSDVCPWYSRHYECEGRAIQIADGRWIGYPYWFGGGKRGEPEDMPWIEEAIWLESWTEVVEVRKFKQATGA